MSLAIEGGSSSAPTANPSQTQRNVGTPVQEVAEARRPDGVNPEVIQQLMDHVLEFKVQDHALTVTYGEVLHSFQKSYSIVNQGRPLPAAIISGEPLLALLENSLTFLVTTVE